MTEVPKYVRTRLANQEPAEHPDANVLAAFAEQALAQSERGIVLTHLARCADCREAVALALPAMEAQAIAVPSSKKQWRVPALRWAAVAACFLVVGAAVLLRDRPPQVGMRSDGDRALPASIPASSAQNTPAVEDQLAAAKRQMEAEQPKKAASEHSLSMAVVARPQEERKAANAMRSGFASPKTRASVEASTGGVGSLQAKEAPRDESVSDLRAAAPMPAQPAAKDKGYSIAAVVSAPAAVGGARPQAEGNETQTVDVEASAAPAVAENSKSLDFPGRAKAAPATAQAEVASKDAEVKKQAIGGFAKSEIASGGAHWMLSGQGQLRRSLDNGATWEAVPVIESVTFHALSAAGVHVWVGGAKGVLYHSADAGTHWTQVKPISGGNSLSDDIVELRFADAQHGQLSTASGEVWSTADAGQSWRKNN